MASLFRARRRRSPEDDGEEDRSGSGRATRRRLSPEEDALSPDEAAAAGAGSSPRWFSSFVSGAKRVITSVLFSSQEDAAASADEEEDGEDGNGLSSDENEDVRGTHGAIVSYSESKVAIEEMVMKETFSRDECDRMVKLIQSRVTDSTFAEGHEYGTPKEISNRNGGVGQDFTGAWRSLSRTRNFPESALFSNIGSGSFSPGSPLQASPELCNAAVMEAKKWLEGKRQGLVSKAENDGPCTFNTDMLNSGFEPDMGSPVDLAKSYMQSLPPWQSPFLGTQKVKTPPSSGLHIYDDEGKSKYSLSSSKVTTKEDYLSKFWENLEESRRARMGTVGNSPDASKFRHYGYTSRLFSNETSTFSFGTLGEPLENSKGTDKVAAAEPANESLPIPPAKDGNNGVVDHVDPTKKDNGNLVKECHPATEVCPGDIAQGNHTTPIRDAADHSGDDKAPAAEPEIHEESHTNSASELRAKEAGPQIQTVLNGSTNKSSVNGLLDQSNANSGLESSGNGNPSFTNSSSALPLASNNEFTESAADAAADGDSVENGTRINSEEVPQDAPKPPYVRRGRKRVVRSTRGKGK